MPQGKTEEKAGVMAERSGGGSQCTLNCNHHRGGAMEISRKGKRKQQRLVCEK